jgi:hypothetical protein
LKKVRHRSPLLERHVGSLGLNTSTPNAPAALWSPGAMAIRRS